jgi:hypothetical protein
VSISFEKFPGKTHVCGVGDVDGLAIKVMAHLDIQMMTKAYNYQALLDYQCGCAMSGLPRV